MARIAARIAAGFAVIAFAAACGGPSTTPHTMNPLLTADAADVPLVIRGVLDADGSSFSSYVRLTAADGKAGELVFLPSELHHTAVREDDLPRSAVTIPAGASLASGQTADVRVTVEDVEHAGSYTGTLKFLLGAQPITEALEIPLELHIRASPDVAPVRAAQTFAVANCTWFDCPLTDLLLGMHASGEVRHIQLDNRTSEPVTVTNAVAVMFGDRTGETVTPGNVGIAPGIVLPAHEVSSVPVIIRPNSLPADHYQGTLRFNVEGAADPVTIDSSLDVLHGAWWALVTILFGILVGRFARDMETPVAKKQVSLLPPWYDLKDKMGAVTNPEAHQFLARKLQLARQKIESGTDTQDVAANYLNNLRTQYEFLLELQNFEEKLPVRPDAVRTRAQEHLVAARSALLRDDESSRTEAEKELQNAKDVIAAASKAVSGKDLMMGSTGDAVAQALHRFADSLTGHSSPFVSKSAEQLQAAEKRQSSRMRSLLAQLSGLQTVNAVTRYWFIRPVLSIVLLVLLLLIGLETLYVHSGGAFGAAGVYDYLPLFLWGITADVAQRTLFDLPARGKVG
jgi:hypothetical protein